MSQPYCPFLNNGIGTCNLGASCQWSHTKTTTPNTAPTEAPPTSPLRRTPSTWRRKQIGTKLTISTTQAQGPVKEYWREPPMKEKEGWVLEAVSGTDHRLSNWKEEFLTKRWRQRELERMYGERQVLAQERQILTRRLSGREGKPEKVKEKGRILLEQIEAIPVYTEDITFNASVMAQTRRSGVDEEWLDIGSNEEKEGEEEEEEDWEFV